MTATTVRSDITIPTETTTLGNGMRVVVHHDPAAPIVAVHMMYHAGSRNERPGRTGLAHLLEHLLFEGSQNCPRGEFDRLLEAVGATNNGSTWFDRTNYYEVVPSHAVELALWLERERMGFFLPVLGAEMLEVQRDVVINERRQSYENRPYGLADERLHQLLFPPEHPYSWPTIGYRADLEAMELSDARSFYERYYAPSNAVLVLAGDIDRDDGFRAAERYFGDLPSRERPSDETRALVPVAGRDIMEDRVSFPRMHRAHVTPAYGTPEWVALDVLAYLLADGESSRLQRRLTRELQLVQDVDAYLYPTELAGIFGIVGTARAGVDSAEIADAVDSVIGAIRDGQLSDDEVTGAIRRARRDHIGAISTVEGRADELAYAATVLGDAAALPRLFDAYRDVDADAIQAAAGAYLTDDTAARLDVVPTGKGGSR